MPVTLVGATFVRYGSAEGAVVKAAEGGFLRRVDHAVVAVAMTVLALVLEWLVVRSVRRAAKTRTTGQSRR